MLAEAFPLVTTLEIANQDPMLVPQWRWNTAHALMAMPAKSRRRYQTIDPGILEAISFLRGEPLENILAIEQAKSIYEQDGSLRAEIEALVLADEPCDQIAKRCNVPPDVIETYEKLFFFLRPYLQSTGWLAMRTVGRAYQYGFQDHQLRQFWAWLAIENPRILKYAIDMFPKSVKGTRSRRLSAYLRDGVNVPRHLQIFVAQQAIPTDEDGMQVSFDVHCRRREIESCPDPDTQRQMTEEVDQAVIQYARLALAGKPRKWNRLCGRNNPHPDEQAHALTESSKLSGTSHALRRKQETEEQPSRL